MTAGADVVIHSLHKTLPSLTQTALIHFNGNRIDRERLRYYLTVYQSSSPSYILMSSMDLCMDWVREHRQAFEDFCGRLKRSPGNVGIHEASGTAGSAGDGQE